jgi:hypothetical protein
MNAGDVVFFWMAGDDHFRGLYGWGRLLSAPYMRKDWQSHGVDVEYSEKFRRPILARTIKQDSVLSDMLIFRAPQATNFLLDQSQTKRLITLVNERGEVAPVLPKVSI